MYYYSRYVDNSEVSIVVDKELDGPVIAMCDRGS
jgi:hypothetical protein